MKTGLLAHAAFAYIHTPEAFQWRPEQAPGRPA